MDIPTSAQVDAAIPSNGVPNRGLTNSLLKAILSVLGNMAGPLIVSEIPSNGGTITLPETDQEVILNLDPSTPLDTLNLVLPTGHLGARLFVASTKAIDMATFTGPGVVNNNQVTFNPGDNVVFFQNKLLTWSRLS